MIPGGLGRSYGDSTLNTWEFSARRLNNLLAFDESSGELTCESDVSLADIIQVFLPRGWLLQVTPGTKYVTIGGAIASDVHGKNHHNAGCFSESVPSFELMLSSGEVKRCDRTQNRDYFLSTCGEMWLTGIILTATIQLNKVHSARINQTVIRAANLEEVFALFKEYTGATCSVAWIDCLATGERRGRSLFFLGEHAENGELEIRRDTKLGIPFTVPGSFLNECSIKFFNAMYYNKPRLARSSSQVRLNSFFYPLDSINNWNRMYGKRGFTQYQFDLPLDSGYHGLNSILQTVEKYGMGSFLAVLKLCGDENDYYLSLPMKGFTSALDFQIHEDLEGFLGTLDKIVDEAGGAHT